MRNNRLAYDEADSPLTKDDGSPIVDSAAAHRILSGCINGLNSDDMMTVADMLKTKGLIDASELAELKAVLLGAGETKEDDAEMASDAAIMMNRRRQVAAGLRSASCLHEPIRRPLSAAQDKAFDERFPDAKRITQSR